MPMSGRAPRQALQQRVAAAILEAAASELVARGDASMTDVATAAGVARATVYRYFPTRQALLDELADSAIRSAGARLASARIDEVPVLDGITRSVRELADIGDLFVLLARDRVRPETELLERHLAGPLRRLVERGQSTGDLRGDVPSGWLTDSLVGIIVSVLCSPQVRGREDTVAAITSLFVDGARVRSAAAA
jgi:TetR/AcrR family transcriptional regulator, mexCD-oprJ operon repressor